MKKVTALTLALIMIISTIPCIGFAATTQTVTESLGGSVLWSMPEGNFNAAAVATAFEGWEASITSGSVNVNTYSTGNTLRYYNESRNAYNNITRVTSPGYGQGSEKIVIEWLMYHDTANDLYFDFSFRDVNDTEIAFFKLDRNATSVGYSHPTDTTEYYAMGYPDTGEECAIVAYNNPDGITHTAQFYVAGEKVSEDAAIEGVIDGFGSIVSSNGLWSTANAAIGFTNLTISSYSSSDEPTEEPTEAPSEEVTEEPTEMGETIESAVYNNHVYIINGTDPSLPTAAACTSSEGSVAEGTIVWNEPASYTVGDNTVTGTVSATFEGETVTKEVSLTVTCYPESFELDDLSCSRSGDATSYFTDNIYGEFFFEFDYRMTNLTNCWVYLSQDAGLWGNGQIGLGTPNDTTGAFKTTVSGNTANTGVNVVTNKTYHMFIKGNAEDDTYSLIMTDSDTGEVLVNVTDGAFRKTSNYINSIRLSVNNASGNFTVTNIRCYAEELMEEEPTEEPSTEEPTQNPTEEPTDAPSEQPTEEPTQYSVVEDAFVQSNRLYGINTTNTNGVMVASVDDANRGPQYDANGETTYLNGSTPTTLGSSRVGLMKFPVADIEENERATLKFYVRSWHSQGFGGGNTFLRIAVTPLADSSWADQRESSSFTVASEPLLDGWSTPVFSGKCPNQVGYVSVDVTEIMHAAKNANLDYISLKLQIYWGAAYIVEREAAVAGGSYEGKAAYIEVSEDNSLKKITTSGAATLTKNGSAMNSFAYVTDTDDVRLQLSGAQVIGSDDGYYTPNESFTVTRDMNITNTLSLGFGLTMVNGAQVRYGAGLDENGHVGSGNGLRFITTVNRTDTLAGIDNAELGVVVSAENSDSVAYIEAEKWQNSDHSVFTTALTNLAVGNYNRKFTATPYVKLDGKTYKGESVTRSMYQVAAGLLVKNDTDNTEYEETGQLLFDVLNAYVNQVGIRLTFSDNADFSDWELRVREDGNGSYTGDSFFEVGETQVDGKVYSVTLTPLGEKTIIKPDWNNYVRINNNNSQVKLYTTLKENGDGTYTLSFDTSNLIMGTYPEEKFGQMKPTYERAVAAAQTANSFWQSYQSYDNWYGSTHPAFWDKAAYHTGNVEYFKLTGDTQFMDYTIDWANYNEWMGNNNTTADPSTWTWTYNQTQGSSAVLFGDWQICFQTYIDLYNFNEDGLLDVPEASVDRVYEVIDYQISKDEDGFWWWADALYMVMPVFTKLYQQTGDEKYLDALYKYFRYAKELMYDGPGGIPTSADGYTTSAALTSGASYSDPDDYKYLFFRDAGYVYPLNPNTGHENEKNFWARGDGWVFAGLAKVLSDMPETYEHYDEFYTTYVEMAAAIVACQQVDDNGYGFWTQSMLQDYPKGSNGNDEGYETSGTGFFTYGLFWGINNGILTDTKYTNAAIRAWGYLENEALLDNGMVGYVQPIGSNATQATPSTTTANFGVGAYLLACCEAARWAQAQ